jgi:hypothetical protein
VHLTLTFIFKRMTHARTHSRTHACTRHHDPCRYNFSHVPLQLQHASNLRVEGSGATIWFAPGGGLQLDSCHGVTFHGLEIDYVPTLAQGVVVDVDVSNKTFTADFDTTFLRPDQLRCVSLLVRDHSWPSFALRSFWG